VDWTLEIRGIIFRPSLLAGVLACISALWLTAILLLIDVTIVRGEDLFTAPAVLIPFVTHYPVPPGKS